MWSHQLKTFCAQVAVISPETSSNRWTCEPFNQERINKLEKRDALTNKWFIWAQLLVWSWLGCFTFWFLNLNVKTMLDCPPDGGSRQSGDRAQERGEMWFISTISLQSRANNISVITQSHAVSWRMSGESCKWKQWIQVAVCFHPTVLHSSNNFTSLHRSFHSNTNWRHKYKRRSVERFF